jgi:hypothetical protein
MREGRGSDGAAFGVFRGVGGIRSPLERDKLEGVPRQGVSFPVGLIRNHGVNHEMNIHEALEVWTKDVGGPSHLSIN